MCVALLPRFPSARLYALADTATRFDPLSLCAHMKGFYARPRKDDDGSLNLLVWEVGIPGKAGVRGGARRRSDDRREPDGG